MSAKAVALLVALSLLLAMSGCDDGGRHTGRCKDGALVSAPNYSKFKKVCNLHGGA